MQTTMLLQAVRIAEGAIASTALLILRKAVRRGVRDQSILISAVLAANFANVLGCAMVPLPMPLHVRCVYTHEAALVARYRLRGVRLFHVCIKHELLGIIFAASNTTKRPMNAVRCSQMRDQPGDKVKLLLAQITGLLATFKLLSTFGRILAL